MQATKDVPAGEVVASADQRLIMHGVPWPHFEAMLALRGDRSAPRITYIEGELEFMSPSITHEGIKKCLARMLELYALERGVRLSGFGSWTLRHAPKERAIEPDECYVMGEPRGKDVPDLAIEVIWTSGGLNKLDAYRFLAVREVWLWRDGALRVFLLEGDTYQEATQSRLFPDLDVSLLGRLASREDQTEALMTWRNALRDGR